MRCPGSGGNSDWMFQSPLSQKSAQTIFRFLLSGNFLVASAFKIGCLVLLDFVTTMLPSTIQINRLLNRIQYLVLRRGYEVMTSNQVLQAKHEHNHENSKLKPKKTETSYTESSF